ncbi:MAG: tryptophan 7-halogenase [Deltaproteobacteria bacterium]|nr:tryptophan 7-halogenase [Deltaproteobacteria bacterium]MCB9787215.1 tryptophan 7-halogenase [Deltaproteobacteria bacterium]
MAPLDVLIIGAGPAGSLMAALLHARGLRVEVVERARFPRFAIGESLLPACLDRLAEADLLEAVRARGYLRKDGALFVSATARRRYDFGRQHTVGYDHAFQVPRDDFDMTLADAVAARGVPFAYETAVTAVSTDPAPRVHLESATGERVVEPRFIVDASGTGRVLPRALGLDRPSAEPPRAALFAHMTGEHRPDGPDGGLIWIGLARPGVWLWVIPFADGRTSVGVVADAAWFDDLPADPAAALRAAIDLEPHVRQRLVDARFIFPPRLLRGYSSSVSKVWGPGYCLVGNATEFLDPVFSSGVLLALESSALAAPLVAASLAGEPADWDRGYAHPLARGVDVFRAFVHAWYDGRLPEIIFAPRTLPSIERAICSVLAGYVWDEGNPFVRDPDGRLTALAQRLERMAVTTADEAPSS